MALSVACFRLSAHLVETRERAAAAGRLSLYRSTVIAELERVTHLPYVLARGEQVIQALQRGPGPGFNARLRDFATRSGVEAIYLIGPDGVTIAASNAGTPDSFLGYNYAFRPYFNAPMEGRPGRFYAIGTTTGRPGYFLSEPVLDGAGRILGVIALKLDLTALEQAWRAAGESVLLANENGVVILASDPGWRYRLLAPLPADDRIRIETTRQFPGMALAALDWAPQPDGHARIDQRDTIHLSSQTLPHGWSLHYFASLEPVATMSWLVTVSALVALAGLVIAWQTRRQRRTAERLRQVQAQESRLRAANDLLAAEIETRRKAEARLQATQDELARASRLAALGELAASVTHELGQPIAALRNQIAAAEIAAQAQPRFLAKLEALAQRMDAITRQLRFFAARPPVDLSHATPEAPFATPPAQPLERVDVGLALREALALLAPQIEAGRVTIDLRAPEGRSGGAPVTLRGSKLRLEQALTNLLRNAMDAMEDQPDPRLTLRHGQAGDQVWIEIRDTGHGLGTTTLDHLSQPFVTTRASGQGMGLGLSITAAIIREHGGSLTARNLGPEDSPEEDAGATTGTRGAIFRVTLPRGRPEDGAAEDAAAGDQP